jgi:hypothetical protein
MRVVNTGVRLQHLLSCFPWQPHLLALALAHLLDLDLDLGRDRDRGIALMAP